MDINNIDLNDPKVKRVLIILFAGFLGVAGIIWFKIKPLYEEMDDLNATYIEKRDRLIEIRQVTTNIGKLRQSVEEIERKRDSLREMFLDSTDIPDLIGTLAKLAVEEGFLTSSFKPLVNEPIEEEYYSGRKYKVVLRGGFHEIGSFIEKILGLDLIVNISNLTIKADPSLRSRMSKPDYLSQKSPKDDIESVIAEFNLITYSINR
ncbi:MAG: type 4a pilus biogenesis protein PilO [Fibrobacterota bacterium]